jgi:hypothetical protein
MNISKNLGCVIVTEFGTTGRKIEVGLRWLLGMDRFAPKRVAQLPKKREGSASVLFTVTIMATEDLGGCFYLKNDS